MSGICPKCNTEIEGLVNWVSGDKRFYLTIDEDKEEQYQEDEFIEDYKKNEFECPECSEVLFTDEDKAIAFLKDEDELQKIVKEKLKQIKENKKDGGNLS